MIKCFGLTLLASFTLSAQESPQARAILKMVADARQTVRSYRAEYKLSDEMKGTGNSTKSESTRTVAFLPPNKVRVEINSGVPVLMISDGKAAWRYMPTLKEYSKLPSSTNLMASAETFPFSGANLDGLQSAQIVREEPVVVDGVPVPCLVIAAEYKPRERPGLQDEPTQTEVTFWVNKNQYTILRSRTHSIINSAHYSGPMEATREVRTTSLRWDVPIPEEEFAFTPPKDATERQYPNMGRIGPAPPTSPKEPLNPGVVRIGNGVSAPMLIRKAEPAYSDEARQAGVEGTVVLSVVVDEQGMPTQLRVLRPLGHGLDEKAIEALQQWRFKPGMKENKPVRVQATIEVNFRLPKTGTKQ